ncbi:MAG: nuclear transport factor 2 family protein [Microscillaceae bacterium]|jgi:ketosteroid isomerase-like protein|nr:nuclear transport factor 2 family protein [Microscillaceae bacterium]
MKYILNLIIALIISHLAYSQNNEQTIRQIFAKQQKAWNEGNIEVFMEDYWHSENLKFIGKNGITKGWQATLDRYKKSYPNREAMGVLTFEIIEIKIIGGKNAFVIGKWHLKRTQDELGGHFTLLWEKIKGKWVIVADHSS